MPKSLVTFEQIQRLAEEGARLIAAEEEARAAEPVAPTMPTEPSLAAARGAIDGHHGAMHLDSDDGLPVRLWHLMVSLRHLCRDAGMDAESLWRESGDYIQGEG